MVLDAALLYTQRYKVRIKGKVGQSREGRQLYLLNLHTNSTRTKEYTKVSHEQAVCRRDTKMGKKLPDEEEGK